MNNKVEFLVPNIILMNDKERLEYLIFNSINKKDSQTMYVHCDSFNNTEVTDQQDYIESICDQMRINFKRLGFVVATSYKALYNPELSATLFSKEEKRQQYEWEITITTLKEI